MLFLKPTLILSKKSYWIIIFQNKTTESLVDYMTLYLYQIIELLLFHQAYHAIN